MKKINIAIDGYSSCGKSTLAKELAKKLHYIHVDSGAMYRAVTLYGVRNKWVSKEGVDRGGGVNALNEIDISFTYNQTTGKSETYLNGEHVEEEIRSVEISGLVSLVSQIKEVRQKLIAFQQKLGKNKGVVMDGRDIGTNVFPDAELKIFMTASLEVRTNRRFKELREKGMKVTIEQVEQNLSERDYQDTNRAENPLRKAEDAIVLDNSEMSPEEQFQLVLNWVNDAL
ncbi:MAG: (d)CMP kinase [Flavobacteriales bacterium]